MRFYKIQILLLALVSLQSSFSNADTSAGGVDSAPTSGSSVYIPPTTAGTNTNSAASNSSASEMINAAGAGVAAAFLIKKCVSTGDTMTCVMGGVEALQAIASLMDSQGSNQTANAAQQADSGITGTTLPGAAATTAGQAGALTASMKDALAQLKTAGYTISPDGTTATLPDGSQVSTAAATSPSGASSLGLSDAQIATGLANEQEAMKLAKAKMASLLKDGDSGSGAGGGGGGGPDAHSGTAGFSLGALTKNKKRAPTNVSGLSKRVGGENIGVAGDNIFEMITRQYKKKDSQNAFLKN